MVKQDLSAQIRKAQRDEFITVLVIILLGAAFLVWGGPLLIEAIGRMS